VFFFGSSRLHVPLLPVLAIMAATEVVASIERRALRTVPTG